MEKLKCLIIDDNNSRQKYLTQDYECKYSVFNARTYDEATELLKLHAFDFISFDHDLNDFDDSGNERTGASIAKYMAYEGMTCRLIRIHSANFVGAQNIRSILESNGVATEEAFISIF